MTTGTELQIPPILQPRPQNSPLHRARLQRKLTAEEAARRADISPDEVAWLDEGRLYRFPSAHAAVSAVLAYGSALGIDRREALELAGRRRPSTAPEALPRILGAMVLAAIFAVVAVALADPRLAGDTEAGAGAQNLPPPWRVSVDVLNGSGDINHTRTVADRIGALAYHISRVRSADRFDYPETAVYYQPGGKAIAARLAESLGTKTKPLPGGKDPRHVIVIVGPATLEG
jgi:LytR cell envelope-related transcriptional attenuator/helix-turn-helix protein